MNDDTFKAALAGLLHDIGKFGQRAGEKFGIPWSNDENSDIKKRYGYQHALYTDQIVERIVPPQWRQGVRGPAGHHHRPQTPQERVVALADHLSAGERSDSTEQQPMQLQSIFCSITGLKDDQGNPLQPPAVKHLPLKKLAIKKEIIFPVDAIDDSHGAYEALWRGFETEATALKRAFEPEGANPAAYLESLLNLMQEYTWCIPSAYYRNVPDVSLYDHSRMTAALAACLAEQPADNVQAWLNKEAQDEPAALLVGGDISGVQKFIYTLTSEGATPALRGRSMYLQLLTQVIARHILDEMDLPLTNIIYAGGGHFYLLVPPQSDAGLTKIQEFISRMLLHHHQGDLYLALAVEPLPANAVAGVRFGDRWDELQKKLQRVKQRKFAELDSELTNRLFTPLEHGGSKEKLCVVCQREHPQAQQWDHDEVIRCPACHQFENLGQQLRKANYLCLEKIKSEPLAGADLANDWRQALAHFGYQAIVTDQPPAEMPAVIERRTLLALSDEAWTNQYINHRQASGRYLLVNVTPILSSKEYYRYRDEVKDLTTVHPASEPVKPFAVMARQSQGIERLGILRMDVDNLGDIFSRGLSGKSFTLSRIAQLSFSINLFFEGWAAQIAQQVDRQYPYTAKDPDTGKNVQFYQRVYSIYSGGDDLFMVGAWDLMPWLAARMSRDLSDYAAGHPGIHVSGGLALIPQKYPLYQAAEDAHEAEQSAKGRRPDGGRKNAFNFLGCTIPWPEFSRVVGYQAKLQALMKPTNGQRPAPKSLLHRLERLYLDFNDYRAQQAQAGKPQQVYWGPGQWRSAYHLARLADRYKHEPEVQQQIEQLCRDLHLDNFTNIEWLGIAARWTELLLRQDKDID
ncbi:MAG: type III-A CRISPR-associated protein Cas10/Csm1 [Chloroflexota bacterium]